MEVEEYRKSDESYYGENFKNNKEDPIHLSEALKLSIIYKNIGG